MFHFLAEDTPFQAESRFGLHDLKTISIKAWLHFELNLTTGNYHCY